MINIQDTAPPSGLPFARADIEQTIPARFEQVVCHFSDRIALTGGNRTWTYRELNRQVNRIARAILDSAGAGPGCVAYLLDHSPEMVIATLAVLKAGKTYLAVHPAMPAPAQLEIMRDVAPQLLLTNAIFESHALGLTDGSCPVLKLDDVSERWSDQNFSAVIKPDDASTIFYTSGTTGQPKGVVKSHRAVLHRVWLSAQHDQITHVDRQSLLTHCSFSASESDIFGALLHGARVCVFDIASIGLAGFRTWLEEEQITLLHPPALLFRRFLATLEGHDLFPSVRLVALAGDVVLSADLEKWQRHFTKSCAVLHRFSTTETALLTVARIESGSLPNTGIVSAGHAVADKMLMLIDEAGLPVTAGETGELVVKSRYLADGYWRRPDATAAVFRPDPEVPGQRIYRTGDLGRFLPDGSLVYLGRRDHQVKIRGYRVDIREVDSALLQLDDVREAATIGRQEGDEFRLISFVVLKDGSQFDPLVLRESLRGYLPDWKIPARFHAIPVLPVTLTGKVDRQRLDAAMSGGDLPASPGAAVSAASPNPDSPTAIEQELAEIWKTALRLDAVGFDDNFLQLGGDSISMMTALDRVERQYGIRIAPAEFFNQGTIRHLAAHIRNRPKPAAARSGPIGRTLRDLSRRILDGISNIDSSSVRSRSEHSSTRIRPASEPVSSDVRSLSTAIMPLSEPESGRADSQKVISVDSVSDGYIEMLDACGVEYIFINPGTDTAPILESIAKFAAQGRHAPKLILCLHESVAMAAAHGHFMISGKPQVVLVHVDVGTQNIGANMHNAQRGRAGVVVCAGRSPHASDGGVPSEHNTPSHLLQEQFNRANIIEGYVKWHYELTRPGNLHLAVQRAFQVASTDPAGPVYLTLPREVLMQKMEGPVAQPGRAPAVSAPAADPNTLGRAAQWLIEAGNPLILVAYAGRNPKAVDSLIKLAETLAVSVVESRHRINFPSSHPLHLGYSAGRYLPHADCILIIDSDIPWIPAQEHPAPHCRIVHIDIDPLKRNMPIWGFPVDLSIEADSSQAMQALADEIERRLTPADRTRIEARRQVLATEHDALRSRLNERVRDLAARKPIAPEWAAHCLSEVVGENTVIVSEAVSNNPVLWNYLRLDAPGTYFQSLGSGLGWGLGAGLGAKLAAPSKTVICVIGDGSWIFSSPIPAYWAAQQHRSPFLTVIFNNQEYAATAEAILAVAPDGYARATGVYPACDLPSSPMYSRISEAMGLWARTVEDPARLPQVLREALAEVRRGRSAVVDICISSLRPVLGMN
jgi:amino acid adenylation domain-containing protein